MNDGGNGNADAGIDNSELNIVVIVSIAAGGLLSCYLSSIWLFSHILFFVCVFFAAIVDTLNWKKNWDYYWSINFEI